MLRSKSSTVNVSSSKVVFDPNKLSQKVPPRSAKVNRFQAKRTRKNCGASAINNCPFSQQSALLEASQNGDRFTALSEKLNKFKKSHKKKVQNTVHQFDWRREHAELIESQTKAEQVRRRWRRWF